MKHFLIAIFMLGVTTGCAQSFNQEVKLEDGKTFLLGKITLEGLQNAPYSDWFNSNYQAYAVDKSLIDVFKTNLQEYHVKLFLGTWCGDSKRETPRILKILEASNFPMDNLDIVALDRREGKVKTSPTGEERGLNILRVPTILFYKNGKEVNRIVESPIETLEEDMAQILSGKSYTPNYATLSKAK